MAVSAVAGKRAKHVANLVHGRKTLLAALALRVREDRRDADGVYALEVAGE